MKRSSSTTKENALRVVMGKTSARGQKLLDDFSKLSCTQSLAPETTYPSSTLSKAPSKDFYKTFGCNNFFECSRPESKQASRKFLDRPETSKGIRTLQRFSRKWRPETKEMGFHSQYVGEKTNDIEEDEVRVPDGEIQIIVTKSSKRQRQRKGIRSKFETDLDDEFLQLFAN